MHYFLCASRLYYMRYKQKCHYYIFKVDSLHQTWKFLSLLASVAKYKCKMIPQFAKTMERSFEFIQKNCIDYYVFI